MAGAWKRSLISAMTASSRLVTCWGLLHRSALHIALQETHDLLSTGTAIPPDIPFSLSGLGALLRNLRTRHALVLAIIPLAHIRPDFDVDAAALQLRATLRRRLHAPSQPLFHKQLERATGARARADEDGGQVAGDDERVGADEGMARGGDARLAVCRQWDVRGARVAAIKRPFGLAVADDEASWSRRRHGAAKWVPTVCKSWVQCSQMRRRPVSC